MPASVSTALLTDMYELTMLDAALHDGTAGRRTVFELFGRRLPTTRRFGVVAGTSRVLEALARFEFSPDQIDWLRDEHIVSDEALDYLRDFRFSGDIDGYAEGEAQAIIEEALRMTAHLGMNEPTARDFAHALVQQPAFRKAVAHEMLHDIYIETHGRAL